MNENLNKKNAMDAVKRFLFEYKVILMFVILSVACIMISGANISYVAGEVFSRFGRNTCLVLALIIPCMAGLGMNFGIVVGAIAAQISIFWVVHWGFTGIGGFMLDFGALQITSIAASLIVGIIVNQLLKEKEA